uniref:EF-hand domain-containing protein n=2 Tax=Hemiselmis andersenii TaxID=464988 RepID=A0A6U4LAN9_HEMAN|mmetsp:Transcript_1761/g.4094  ORF Transcript_1761/g.4094 Transcript_1761/m.4094 type:complete len:903 (+) Transcript_1761:252-2960(+)
MFAGNGTGGDRHVPQGLIGRLKARRANTTWHGLHGVPGQSGGDEVSGILMDGGIGALPGIDTWRKVGEVKWLGKEGAWHDRRLILTGKMLIITHLNEEHIKDQIPVIQIHSCESLRPRDSEHHASFGALPLQRPDVQRQPSNLGHLRSAESLSLADYSANSAAQSPRSAMSGHPPAGSSVESLQKSLLRGVSTIAQSVGGMKKTASNTRLAPVRLGEAKVRQHNVGDGLQTSLHGHMTEIVLDEVDRALCFDLTTEPNGYNLGRNYIFQCDTPELAHEWVRALESEWEQAIWRETNLSRFDKFRLNVELISLSRPWQALMVALILANFVLNVIQAELKFEEGTYWEETLSTLEVALTLVFAFELIVNLFANWFWPFFTDGWSVFDLIVVTLSLLAIAFAGVGDFNNLRLLRPLRVVRLLGRLESLRLIINACTRSLIPVFNAFLVTFLITAIYAILGVTAFDNLAPEYFDTFSISLFTMFQITTGDAWGSDVARTMLRRKELCQAHVEADVFSSLSDCYRDSWESFGTAWATRDNANAGLSKGILSSDVVIFFSSFQIFVSLTLLNVVVAVLLDNFTMATEAEKEQIQSKKIQETVKPLAEHPLDPLLSKLVMHDSSDELTAGISVLFRTLDTSLNGTVSREELQEGLRKIQTDKVIDLAESDFEGMTNGLLDDDGELSSAAFETMLRRELTNFVQRHMARQIQLSGFNGRQDPTVLFALKKIMLSVDERLHGMHGGVEATLREKRLSKIASMDQGSSSSATFLPIYGAASTGANVANDLFEGKLRHLEAQNKLLQDAIRMQSSNIEHIMKHLHIPTPNRLVPTKEDSASRPVCFSPTGRQNTDGFRGTNGDGWAATVSEKGESQLNLDAPWGEGASEEDGALTVNGQGDGGVKLPGETTPV